eukprot:1967600-Prymnesium_polylepis.1
MPHRRMLGGSSFAAAALADSASESESDMPSPLVWRPARGHFPCHTHSPSTPLLVRCPHPAAAVAVETHHRLPSL